MRPVVRGDVPQDRNGNDKQFTDYTLTRGELIRRLGEYCSYCEMQLDASLAVEHVRPKQPPDATGVMTERELDWNNFLLACTNCNSTKGNIDVVLNDYFWPNRDNTFLALTYSEGGVISPSNQLDPDDMARAIKTISLTGLDKYPNNDPKASDRRWRNRREAWDIAQRAKQRLTQNDNDGIREQIVETAQAKGFWSVWMTVFENDTDILGRLIGAFAGTCDTCFDVANDYVPTARPGGLC